MNRPRPGSKTSSLAALLLVLAAAGFAPCLRAAGPRSRLAVVGHDDPQQDRANLQAALDQAAPGDTIELSGVFQLDGERLFLTRSAVTLEGSAVDDDGDGRVNEDWADGLDNDGDGRVDEDDWNAVLRGVTDTDGVPAPDPDPVTLFNRGLVLEGFGTTVRSVVIRNLKFEGHNRALTLEPEVHSTSNLCSESTTTAGRIAGLRLEGNLFENNTRAVQVFGRVEDFRVEDNVFVGNRAVDLLLVGRAVACVGDPGSVAVGTPSRTRILLNTILRGNIGLFSDHTESTVFRGNRIQQIVLGVFTRADRSIEVRDNSVANSVRAITTAQPSFGARILDNLSVDSSTVGILLQNGSSGYFLEGNRFLGSATADLVLDGTTSGNVAVVEGSQQVLDLGSGNRVLIRGDEGGED